MEGIKPVEGNGKVWESVDDADKQMAGEQSRQPDQERKKDHDQDRDHDVWSEMGEVSPRLEDNIAALEHFVGLNESFDVLIREMTFGGRRTGLFYLNGFAKDEVLTLILFRLSLLDDKELSVHAFTRLMRDYVPHIQVEEETGMSKIIHKVLAGASALFIDRESSAIVIDAKSFPVRTTEEPSLEKVVRGSRDGFVETLLTNISLVRRRLRDPRLKADIMTVGRRTRTDVCLVYISDIADKRLVEEIKKRIRQVDIDGIPLADKQLEELIIGKTWNPFPQVRYSERPDVIATHLLEGHLVIMVDTSPSAMILPSTFFHLIQHAEEYRQTPVMGTYVRWIRFFGIWASMFLLPLWFLFVLEPQLIPEGLEFIGPKEKANLPLLVQFLFAEIGVDLVRMAAVHTPTPLASAMGLIAALLIGEFAVKTGLFVTEVVLYMAIASIGMFATPSYELGLANRLVRLVLLFAVALFQVKGFVVATTVMILLLVLQRTFHSPYMWPFIPFEPKAMFAILVRKPIHMDKVRLSMLKPRDSTRQP
jgi:stage V sporulation protein AF